MTGPSVVIVEFVKPAPFLSLNDRMHWRPRAERVKTWRTAAWAATVNTQARNLGPSFVEVYLPINDSRRRDPSNLIATTKACVDGMTDAGLWPDDDERWVSVREPVLCRPNTALWNGAGVVRIEVTPR